MSYDYDRQVQASSPVTATVWIEGELQKLDLDGRDDFYTYLITQEIPMWLASVREGKSVPADEVQWLIQRRGFNAAEATKLTNLAVFFNDNGAEIRRRFTPPS